MQGIINFVHTVFPQFKEINLIKWKYHSLEIIQQKIFHWYFIYNIFSWIYYFLNICTLNIPVSLVITHTTVINHYTEVIFSYYFLWLLCTVYNLVDPLNAVWGAVSLHWMQFIQLDIISNFTGKTWECKTVHSMTSYVNSYHTLLLIDTDSNCMTTCSWVCTCTASLPHVRKKGHLKLIRMV